MTVTVVDLAGEQLQVIDVSNPGTTPGLQIVAGPPGDAAIGATKVDKGSLGVNIVDYGASTGAADNTAFIQAAISASSDVSAPPGTFNVLGTVEITNGKRLHLSSGTILLKPSTAGNTDPVVWVKSSNCGIDGAGMGQSTIQSDCASPTGVVCVGYKGVSDAVAKNVNYTTVRGLSIIGKTNGGETTGTPSIALYLCNRSLSGLVSYFCNAQDLYLARANIGLWLQGYSNGHIINRLHLYHCGDEKQLDGAGIKLSALNGTEVPVDNSISQVFHHTSPNAVTVYLDGPVFYDNLTDIMAEQSGATAQFIKNNDDAANSNNITGLDNVTGGSNLTANFLKKNSLVTRGILYAKSGTFDTITVSGTATGTFVTPPNVQEFTTNGTWTKPAGAKLVEAVLFGGAGGGGSGRRGAAATVRAGGAGGGGGASFRGRFDAADLPASCAVVIGGAGAGGAAVTANDTNGNPGTNGGTTTFGTVCCALRGNLGAGGTTSAPAAGVGGIGQVAGGTGAAGSVGAAAPTTAAASGAGTGGAGGGGISAADAVTNGGAATVSAVIASALNAGGIVDSTLPVAGAAPALKGQPGSSGGGGAASITTAAQDGRPGVGPGAAGSGGGASLNGNNSGAGGAGTAGYCLVVTTF